MITIEENIYNKMPEDLKSMFVEVINEDKNEILKHFPNTKSGKLGPWNNKTTDRSPNGIYGVFSMGHVFSETYGDSGSAARFFYCAKASKSERDLGLENMPGVRKNAGVYGDGLGNSPKLNGMRNSEIKNHHPTVKPIKLMRYLCKLVTPTGGTVLDPFCGSGSTLIGAELEGFNSIGIDLSEEYCEISKKRLNHYEKDINLFS